nr:hypothetical protein [Tanacetum cinerariifolium]
MAALPICDELRRSVGKSDWEPQFILRCHREISEDLRLAREINTLYMRLIAIVNEREVFADELNMLMGEHVLDKMVEFTKQSFACSVIVARVDGGFPDVHIHMLAVSEGSLGSVVVATSEPSFFCWLRFRGTTGYS